MYFTKFLLCLGLTLSMTHYAQNYTGIIGGSLSYNLRVKFLEVAICIDFCG